MPQNVLLLESVVSHQEKSLESLQKTPVERPLKDYAKPQLIVYGPVAGLTGGMSNFMFADMAGMTMLMA